MPMEPVQQGWAFRWRHVITATTLLGLFTAVPAAFAPALADDVTTVTRSRVPTPSIILTPATATAKPHQRINFIAVPHGGEAMLFSVTWTLVEGQTGGRLEFKSRHNRNGSYLAIYTAPEAAGTYHVSVSLREFPAATAVATIIVKP